VASSPVDSHGEEEIRSSSGGEEIEGGEREHGGGPPGGLLLWLWVGLVSEEKRASKEMANC
jgi:hypothetical protein